MSKESDTYGTPKDLYEFLNERFVFQTDPCTSDYNPLGTPIYYTEATDGLAHHWTGPVFMNPPYSKVTPWVKKAWQESCDGSLVVGLVRHDPSTRWWEDWIRGKAQVIEVPYRIKFVGGDGLYNFPSAIVIWWGHLAARPGHS